LQSQSLLYGKGPPQWFGVMVCFSSGISWIGTIFSLLSF